MSERHSGCATVDRGGQAMLLDNDDNDDDDDDNVNLLCSEKSVIPSV